MFIILNIILVVLVFRSVISKNTTILQLIGLFIFATLIPLSFGGTIAILAGICLAWPTKVLVGIGSFIKKIGYILNTRLSACNNTSPIERKK